MNLCYNFYMVLKGQKLSEDIKRKISETKKAKGQRPSFFANNKGRKFSEDWKRKIGESNKGKNLGRKFSEEHCKNLSEAHKGKCKGKLNPNWNGGKSFEPYGLEFNKDLREVIRNRDRRKCQVCEKTELEEKRKLSVHHIDFNKHNNNPNNLITLCLKCHMKTNFHRNYWINYFYAGKIKTTT